jgi:hypothetical protein
MNFGTATCPEQSRRVRWARGIGDGGRVARPVRWGRGNVRGGGEREEEGGGRQRCAPGS